VGRARVGVKVAVGEASVSRVGEAEGVKVGVTVGRSVGTIISAPAPQAHKRKTKAMSNKARDMSLTTRTNLSHLFS